MTVLFRKYISVKRSVTYVGVSAVFAIISGCAFAAAPAHLEKVVVVMRHGVRAPTKSTEWLSKYSKEPWYKWPVAPGILTRHGADGATAMGARLKAFYAGAGILSEKGCANTQKVYVWGDGEDSRTRASGDAAARGLMGKCAGPAHFKAPAGSPDPVFTHEGNKALQLDPAVAEKTLMADAPGHDLNHLGPEYDAALKAMVRIVYPGLTASDCKGKDAPKACIFVTGKNRFQPAKWKVRVKGPLKTGSSFAENLLLEFAQRDPQAAVGWGRAGTEADIAAIMPLHNIYTKLTRQNDYYAARRGAVLTSEIADLISDQAPRAAGAAPVPEKARFVLFLGHDSNLSNLAGLFDLSWSLAGEPDLTAPNTALAFERWRAADGHSFVRVRIFWQTLQELRAKGTKARGSQQSVEIPHCNNGKENGCSVQRFANFARSKLPKSITAAKLP